MLNIAGRDISTDGNPINPLVHYITEDELNFHLEEHKFINIVLHITK